MPIFKGSRYEYSTIDYVPTTFQGAQNPIVFYTFSTLGQLSYFEHAYVEGERLDQLSERYFKNPQMWWAIPEVNPEILDFTNIAPGTIIRIPNV